MKRPYLRTRTILCMVLLAVLLIACGKDNGSGDSSSEDTNSEEVLEVELPDIQRSEVELHDEKDVIATFDIEKEIKGIDVLGIGASMGVLDGYVEGTIDIIWQGPWWNIDGEAPTRWVAGVGTGAASISDLIGGGVNDSGTCDESLCCKYTYSWDVTNVYYGIYYAIPSCQLTGSITAVEWINPVLVDSYGACGTMLPPEFYAELFKTLLPEFSVTPGNPLFVDFNKGPMAEITTTAQLNNFPWEEGLCKAN